MAQGCLNHYPLLPTLRSKRLSRSMMKRCAIYTNLQVNAIVRLCHPHSGDTRRQETYLVPSAEKQSLKCDTRVLKQPSFTINSKVKGTGPYQDEMVSHIYKFTSKCHSQTTPSLEQKQPGYRKRFQHSLLIRKPSTMT